jgi:hypothetical protein
LSLFRARTPHGKFGIFFFFFLNRINLINGLVQTFGLKQVIIWAYFVLWAENKCCYLCLSIFEYGKLGLLDKGVHKLFEDVHNFYLRVFTIFFLVENIYIKKKKFLCFF